MSPCPGSPGPGSIAVPGWGSLASLEARHAAFLSRFQEVGAGRQAKEVEGVPDLWGSMGD